MSLWSGLGISVGQPYGSWFEFNANTHVAIGAPFWPIITQFPRLRIIEDQGTATSLTANRLWAVDLKKYNPTTYISYGIANSGSVYLPTFYAGYLTKMQSAAQFAQDNLMDQFQVANELEISNQLGTLSITSLTMSGNVVTMVTASAHGLTTNDTIVVSGASPSYFNVSQVACTVIDSVTLTYPAVGADASATGTLVLKVGETTIIRFVKLLAVAAQAIFTRGPIIYSVSQGHETNWTSITPETDLDLIGLDIYGTNGSVDSWNDWQSRVDAMYAVFGTQMIVTEFNLNSTWSSSLADRHSPTNRGFDTRLADQAYKRMKYLQSKGITQGYFFQAWGNNDAFNNLFTAWYNTATVKGNGAGLLGNWKAIKDRLFERRQSKVFLGTEQAL